MQQSINGRKYYIWIIAIAILTRVCVFPFAQTIDADAVSRTFLTLDWMDQPHWIGEGVWLPFHYYLNTIALFIWDDQVYSPALLNSLFSLLTIPAFYQLTKREFDIKGALITTVLFALSPILFRNQFMALSETSYLFFLVHSLNWISRGMKDDRLSDFILAGIFITVASGIRYESWLITAVIGCFLLVRNVRSAFIFGSFASLFPISWLASNYLITGDAFSSLSANHHWTLEVMENNANVDVESYLRRIWFFPFSLLIAIGPPAAYFAIKGHFRAIRQFNLHFKTLLALLFAVFLCFFIYNSIQGTLLLQHRFIGTLVVFFLPFAAEGFRQLSPTRILAHAVVVIALSYVYNVNNISPIPRLKDQAKGALYQHIPKATETLILDDLGWDYTYYYALMSRIDRKKIILIEGATNSPDRISEINEALNDSTETTLFVRKGSQLDSILRQRTDLLLIHGYEEVLIKKNSPSKGVILK